MRLRWYTTVLVAFIAFAVIPVETSKASHEGWKKARQHQSAQSGGSIAVSLGSGTTALLISAGVENFTPTPARAAKRPRRKGLGPSTGMANCAFRDGGVPPPDLHSTFHASTTKSAAARFINAARHPMASGMYSSTRGHEKQMNIRKSFAEIMRHEESAPFQDYSTSMGVEPSTIARGCK